MGTTINRGAFLFLPAFLSVIEGEIEVVEHIYNGRFQLVVFLKYLPFSQ
ncbi:MAG: hypothetical protein V3U87_03130 [Methylococcaceae bacterium]